MPVKDNALIIETSDTALSGEEGATIVPLENGGIRISVAEEKAVDSYNASFTCSITMSKEQVQEDRAMLVRFQMPYVKLGSWWFVAIPLLVGNVIFKHRKDMLFSERYGGMPGIFIGPLRISWVRYRKLGEKL